MKNMLNFKNFTAEELMGILELALDMKKNPEKYADSLKGKKLYTLFEKTSTRTFLSFATIFIASFSLKPSSKYKET